MKSENYLKELSVIKQVILDVDIESLGKLMKRYSKKTDMTFFKIIGYFIVFIGTSFMSGYSAITANYIFLLYFSLASICLFRVQKIVGEFFQYLTLYSMVINTGKIIKRNEA